MSDYPEHEKMVKVKDDAQVIGDFLTAMSSVRGYEWVAEGTVCEECGEPVGGWWPDGRTVEQLLAAYFDIDLDRIAEEKQDMYERLGRAV